SSFNGSRRPTVRWRRSSSPSHWSSPSSPPHSPSHRGLKEVVYSLQLSSLSTRSISSSPPSPPTPPPATLSTASQARPPRSPPQYGRPSSTSSSVRRALGMRRTTSTTAHH